MPGTIFSTWPVSIVRAVSVTREKLPNVKKETKGQTINSKETWIIKKTQTHIKKEKIYEMKLK